MDSRRLVLAAVCLWAATAAAGAAGTTADHAAARPAIRAADARVRQAVALMQKDQLDAARVLLDAAIHAAPGGAAAWSKRAELDILQDRIDDAIADASHVLELHADQDVQADAYLTRETAWGKKGEDARMLADMDRGTTIAPARADFLERRALWAIDHGRWDLASAAASRALGINLQCATCRAERAFARARLGEREAALADAKSAVARAPGDSMVRRLYGDTLAALGDHRRAIEEFDKALAIDPGNSGTRFDRGDSYQSLRDLASAIADYSDVLEHGHYSDPGAVLLSRGVAFYRANDLPRAIADLHRAVEMHPADPIAADVLGRALEDSGDTTGAVEAYGQAATHETDGRSAGPLGRLEMFAGHFAQALEPLRAMVRGGGPRSSTYGPLWLYQSRLRADAADQDAARAELARLAPPHEPRVWTDELTEFMLDRIDAATLQQRAQGGPQDKQIGRHCEADYYVAEIELAHGHRDAALPLLDEAVRICPSNFDEAHGAQAELRRQAQP